MSVILTLSDLHCPVQHEDAFDFLADLKREYKPDTVICLGDESEMHHFSKWNKSPDAPGLEEEVEETLEQLRILYKIFPKVKSCVSNHTFRYVKRAQEAGLSRRMIKDIGDILEAPKGWSWADKWVIDDTIFMHGEESNDPIKLIKQYRKNVVVGHSHSKAGVAYSNNGVQQNWCLQVGALIDPISYAMAYTKAHLDKPVLGTGIIIDGVPQFIPMLGAK